MRKSEEPVLITTGTNCCLQTGTATKIQSLKLPGKTEKTSQWRILFISSSARSWEGSLCFTREFLPFQITLYLLWVTCCSWFDVWGHLWDELWTNTSVGSGAAKECKPELHAAPKQSVPASIADPHTAGGFQSHGRTSLRAAQRFRRGSQEAAAACGTQASLQSERGVWLQISKVSSQS